MLVEVIRIIEKLGKTLLHLRVVLEYDLGSSIQPASQVQHPLGKLSVVYPIIDLLKPLPELQPLGVQLNHILVILKRHHVGSELDVELLLLVFVAVLLE